MNAKQPILVAESLERGQIRFCPGRHPDALSYYAFLPDDIHPLATPLVLVHGISRNALEQLGAFVPLAATVGRPLLAPVFDRKAFPRYQRLAHRGVRADRAFQAMLAEAGDRFEITTGRVDLFGFSAGAQYVHRFALLAPDSVRRLAVSSAGWYTFPDPERRFPVGTRSIRSKDRGPLPMPEFDPRGFAGLPMLVLVGERDVQVDENVRSTPGTVRRQGITRRDRARRFAEAWRSFAAAEEIECDIRHHLLPRCGHSFSKCVRRGALAHEVMDFLEGRSRRDRSDRTREILPIRGEEKAGLESPACRLA